MNAAEGYRIKLVRNAYIIDKIIGNSKRSRYQAKSTREVWNLGKTQTNYYARLPDADPELTPLNFVLRFRNAQIKAEPSSAAKMKFYQLMEEWKSETEMMSLTVDKCMHPAYQKIIGMGPEAIPLILSQLAAEPDDWFWALKSITCENPVTEEEKGDADRMTKAWLEWGRSHGYFECSEYDREVISKPETMGLQSNE